MTEWILTFLVGALIGWNSKEFVTHYFWHRRMRKHMELMEEAIDREIKQRMPRA